MTGPKTKQILEDNLAEDIDCALGDEYVSALVGKSNDDRLVYDYLKMVECAGNDKGKADSDIAGAGDGIYVVRPLLKDGSEPEKVGGVPEMLRSTGHPGAKYFSGEATYDTAIVGITADERLIYDFDEMLGWYAKNVGGSEEGISDEDVEDEAIDLIDNAVSYLDRDGAPIVVYRFKH